MALEFKETKQDKVLIRKIKFTAIIVVFFFSLIILRLCYFQIIKGSRYTELSTNNRIRQTTLPAPRGHILSGDNQTLVDNIPSFDLMLIPQDAVNIDILLNEVASLLNIDKADLENAVKSRRGRPRFEAIPLKKDLAWNEMSKVLSRKNDLPGISINVVPRRRYLGHAFAPHVFGFLGEAEPEDLTRKTSRPYRRGELLGKYGLEKLAEDGLRGSNGFLQTEVDAFGKRKKILSKIAPHRGGKLLTTLIPAVQRAANQMLQEKTGAIVALDPRNGNILALASAPGFDPNLFSRGINVADWRSFTSDPYNPLLNRAIQCQQPPGSIFKIVTVVAALEEKKCTPDYTFFCPGFYVLGNRRFHCWKNGGHGTVAMREALVYSCDTYFYNLALKVGIKNIVKYAEMLGFGVATGIDLEGEKSGLLPSPEWLRKKRGADWQQGDTLNFCIGQGFLQATPLQMAAIYGGITQNGTIFRPRLLLPKKNEHGENPGTVEKKYSLSDSTFCFLKEALCGVVNDPHGTGYKSRVAGVVVAGKTGTAQVVSQKKKPKKGSPVPRHLENHAWFIAFSPVTATEIVVCVFLEHGGSGGGDAAPVAQEVLKAYYDYKKTRGL